MSPRSLIRAFSDDALQRREDHHRRRFPFKVRRKSDSTIEVDFDKSLASMCYDSQGKVIKGCLKREGERKDVTRTISWDKVEFHCHAALLGDNAAVSCGPPITIEWKAFDHQTLSIDDYEKDKATPRAKNQMILPRIVREDRLRHVGYSRGELQQATAKAAMVQQQRAKSAKDGFFMFKLKKWSQLRVIGTNASQLEPGMTEKLQRLAGNAPSA